LLDKLRKEKYDVVLLDISLQGGNGLDLIGQIKKMKPQVRAEIPGKLPIIITMRE
jgi:DNA-binding NarL/FixJ family response regulator